MKTHLWAKMSKVVQLRCKQMQFNSFLFDGDFSMSLN